MSNEEEASPMSTEEPESSDLEPPRKSRGRDTTHATPGEGASNALITYTGPPLFVQLLSEPKSFHKLSSERVKKIVKSLTDQFGHLSKVMIARRGDLKINPSTPVQKQSLLDLTSVDGLNIKCILTRGERDFRAVIYGVPLDLEIADIVAELSSSGVLEAKRMPKWDDSGSKQEATRTVVLKFASARFPDRVMLAFQSFPVRKYITPPTQCKNCWEWTHWQDECKAPAKCRRCGGSHPPEEGPCKKQLKCVNCSKVHLTGTRQCPDFARRQDTMRTATVQGIGYEVAAKMGPPATTAHPVPSPQAANNHNLEKELTTLKKRMDEYEKRESTVVEKHPIITTIRSSLSTQAAKIAALEADLSDVKENYTSMAEAVDGVKSEIQSLAEESKRRHEELMGTIAAGRATSVVSPPRTRSNSRSGQQSGIPVPIDNDKDKNRKKGTKHDKSYYPKATTNGRSGSRRFGQMKRWPSPTQVCSQSSQHKEVSPVAPPPMRPPSTARKKDHPSTSTHA